MEKQHIKVGVGVMILDGSKILLGHRVAKREDTGGIFEPDTWTLPGGKQEYDETILECAAREVKEETDLDISDFEIYSAADDIQPDRHFITIQVIAHSYYGEAKVMEPLKQDKWKWFELTNLPKNVYTPSAKFINDYKRENNL